MRRSVAAPVLLGIVAFCSVARADVRPSAQATSANEAVQRGDAARKARRWADARAAYAAAFDQGKDPAIAGELGTCELVLGEYRDAAEHLYLSLQRPEALTAEQHRRFAEAKSSAQEHIATLAISANPPDAEVFVDGKSLGRPHLSYIVFVEPGTHFVRGRFKGMADARTSVDALPGGRPIVALELQPAKPSTAIVPVAPERNPVRTWRTVGFVAAGVAIAAGGGLSIAAAAVNGQVNDQAASLGSSSACYAAGPPRACEDIKDRTATRDTLAIGASASFIAGAVLGGAALSTFLWADDDRGFTVSTKATGREFGAVLRGAW